MRLCISKSIPFHFAATSRADLPGALHRACHARRGHRARRPSKSIEAASQLGCRLRLRFRFYHAERRCATKFTPQLQSPLEVIFRLMHDSHTRCGHFVHCTGFIISRRALFPHFSTPASIFSSYDEHCDYAYDFLVSRLRANSRGARFARQLSLNACDAPSDACR